MTMIAIALKGDTAELMTDTASYVPTGRSFGRTTKVHPFPHLSMAVLGQGDSTFGDLVASMAFHLSGRVQTFGDMIDAIPAWLREGWAAHKARLSEVGQNAMQDANSTAFLVGYDEGRGKFRAFAYPSEVDFEPTELKGMFVTPSPWGHRPSKVELTRMRTAGHNTIEQREEAARLWQAKPPLRAPRTAAEWTQLARAVRTQRALEPFCKVFVAGSVFLTRLGVDSVQTEKIHEYDDSGDEFLKMVQKTEHPMGQLSPCDCGSGKTFRDCHLTEWYENRGSFVCACGSGEQWADCCRVAGDVPAEAV